MARITLFTGRFGCGKTEVAINYALRLHQAGAPVTLVDLDIVTPYFRSRDRREPLEVLGLEVVAPTTYGRYSEPVALSGAILGALERKDRSVVVDVGGDDSGARVVGTYATRLLALDHAVYFVANPYRLATATTDDIARAVESIERASRLKVNALVSNPNLMHETTPALVLTGHRTVVAAGRILGLPVAFLGLDAALAGSPELVGLETELLPLQRHFLPVWEEGSYDVTERSHPCGPSTRPAHVSQGF